MNDRGLERYLKDMCLVNGEGLNAWGRGLAAEGGGLRTGCVVGMPIWFAEEITGCCGDGAKPGEAGTAGLFSATGLDGVLAATAG